MHEFNQRKGEVLLNAEFLKKYGKIRLENVNFLAYTTCNE